MDESVAVIRVVDSIIVGNRHRKDLGDIAGLAASIERDGLLQPITVTPDGVLVCGARRLAAIKTLEWTTVRVWVRSGISDDLGHMLAEQDDNVLHKPLTPLESAELYREMKALLAEDAAERKAATHLSTENQPRWNGCAKLAQPLETPTGRARNQAAQMVTGSSSYTTLERIGFLQRLAEDETQPEEIRNAVRQTLDEIRDGAPVLPRYERVKQLVSAATADRTALLHRIADERLAEARADKKLKRKSPASTSPAPPTPMSPRAFIITWKELAELCDIADVAVIAEKLTTDEAEMFFTAIDRWHGFATQLRAAMEDLRLAS